MPTLDEVRAELVRSRGFIRGADTQLTKAVAYLDEYMAGQAPPAPEPGPVLPDIAFSPDNFETREAMLATMWQSETIINPGGSIELVEAPTALTGRRKAMRFGFGVTGPCNALTVGCQFKFAPVQEFWARVQVCTSPNFRTYNPACPAPTDHKLAFANTVDDANGRFMNHWGKDTLGQGIGWDYPTFGDGYPPMYPGYAMPASRLWDGAEHVLGYYFRCSTGPTSGDGALKASFDGVVVWDVGGFSVRKANGQAEMLWGFGLGRNKDDHGGLEEMFMYFGNVDISFQRPAWAA